MIKPNSKANRSARSANKSPPNGTSVDAARLMAKLEKAFPQWTHSFEPLAKLSETKAVLDAPPATQAAFVVETGKLIANAPHGVYPSASAQVALRLLRRSLPFTHQDMADIFSAAPTDKTQCSLARYPFLPALVQRLEDELPASGGSMPEFLDKAVRSLRDAIQKVGRKAELELAERLGALVRGRTRWPLFAGEAWADQAIADLNALPTAEHAHWLALLNHCYKSGGANPTDTWLSKSGELLDQIGAQAFRSLMMKWFPLVDKPRTERIEDWREWLPDPNQLIIDPHMDILKGLAWCCGLVDDPDLARALRQLAVSAYRKVPKIGPRAVKVGNACVTGLGMMPGEHGVGQLAVLRAGVKFGTAQKSIDKAYNAAAARSGICRDDLEEMGVPTYGLEEVGLRRETFAGGECTAELRVDGRDVALCWYRADGKPQKSVPAKVRSEHKEELKELQQSAKDVAAMLPAQAGRIDAMFLRQKQWPMGTWRERYLAHPLVGTLARRLIWSFNSDGREQVGLWHEGALVDVEDRPLNLPDTAEVQLWHPIGRPMDDVLAWRAWLERHQVRQPFKQAHREVYVLTDAERNTRTYSNRFAAHVIRQHQFNALCAARGWKNKLRLMVDDVYPPASRELPAFGLRAEFWVEGIGDDYGTDTNESGVYLRLSTDQVRFYRVGAAENLAHAGGGRYESRAAGPGDGNINEPIPLDQVPPLPFSEVMRDVDLFVGVASVGNDPTWQDGGPEGRYRTYWHSYSFGELGETAKTRRAVLERLIPRLKIADRCSPAEKFLIVRGDLRTYKIHLGSGNILMEPNDRYLCIVPDRSSRAEGSDLFLPFEGDATLSVILSKAFLLAEDRKIKDPTITRQIAAG